MSTHDERRTRTDGTAGRWAVYDQHQAAIRRYVARRVEPSAVDDLTAETFAVAWRRLPRHAEDPLPWLYGVARKVVHGHRRSHARRGALVRKLGDAGEDRTASGDPQARLTGDPVLAPAFASLSERDREALALVAWEGLDNHAAARVVGCSAATFAVRLTRARARLQAALEVAEASADRTAAADPAAAAGRAPTRPDPSVAAPTAITTTRKA
ncbi:Putative RNA polymerase ECF-subfamily sigma factor [Patulibacter medicamentivorans]|uniref:Putative RNA polymerase ECF-subfamily sigma factor n=1 Tax=Patulibacter medicamentivorans TaxID=1097667 RepID=H0E5B2_9ACTN|nr:sigma-70 family RNA polymerase sigma factor [Patulibacter medicamentivorans]EHN11132.1 Putative RNA polymerase ECF-subfamily sigma factor [Patulibacter medicamentivorans]